MDKMVETWDSITVLVVALLLAMNNVTRNWLALSVIGGTNDEPLGVWQAAHIFKNDPFHVPRNDFSGSRRITAFQLVDGWGTVQDWHQADPQGWEST